MKPIEGRNYTFSRFYRHAFLLALDTFENATMNRIFTAISEWHFSQGFSDKVTLLTKVICYFPGRENKIFMVMHANFSLFRRFHLHSVHFMKMRKKFCCQHHRNFTIYFHCETCCVFLKALHWFLLKS